MVVPAVGSVVLIDFPFSDLSQTKLRPAAVIAAAGRGDWILCQITSKSYADPAAETLLDTDFATGRLIAKSFARPGKLFTANESLFVREVAILQPLSRERLINAVIQVIQPQATSRSS